MSSLPPSLPTEPSDPDDTIRRGCLMGCGVQLALIGLMYGASLFLPPKYFGFKFLAFCLIQWAVLIPLIRSEHVDGNRNSPIGLVISGAIGMLLLTTCGRAMFA